MGAISTATVQVMALLKCQVVIPADNADPADVVVNTWGFITTPTDAGTWSEIKAMLKAFYDAWATNRSSLYVWENTRIKSYDMGEAKPRVPTHDELLGLSSSAGTTSLPQEVSLCLSFQATKGSGLNQRRRRGRVYLGPFVTNANQGTTGRPDSTFLTSINTAAQTLLNTSNTSSGVAWVVISEATGTAIGNGVDNGWVDNAWDSQRRRGNEPSSRLLFTTSI